MFSGVFWRFKRKLQMNRSQAVDFCWTKFEKTLQNTRLGSEKDRKDNLDKQQLPLLQLNLGLW